MKSIGKFIFSLAILGFISTSAMAAEVSIGQAAPEFSLSDIHGQTRTLSEFKGKYVVLEWVNPDCPFVKKHYSGGNMQGLQKTYTEKGVIWLSINSSAAGKQGNYSPEEWVSLQAEKNVSATATLLDPDGVVGHQYGAKTTPHLFIVDPAGNLIYQGAIDDKSSTDSADIASSTNYVAKALDEVLAGKPVSVSETKPYGCSVKY